MALENVGIGGVLKFDERQAVRGMTRAGRIADRFRGQFNGIVSAAAGVGRGIGMAVGSMRSLGVAAIPLTIAMGASVNTAQSFEKQMSAVEAVSQATAEEMAMLTAEAKKQGATTAFSAIEAGQGLENLARAGFTVTEQIAALGPTLNAAAADGIDLATASDIVSNTLKGLALPATDAARVADVLALASAKTNTNMVGLGEAMKFAAPQAKTLGISLETTTALLGAAADAGLRGTIGGTSFTQALVKLTKPSKAGAALLEKFNVKMTKTADGGLDVVDVFSQINKGLSGINDVTERAAAQTEIFGIRGQKAFAAAATAIDTGKLGTLVEQLNNAEGAAERMAKTRLDNLAGAFTLLRSAAEGFALETAGAFIGPMTEGVKGFTENLSNIVLVLQELNSEEGLTVETSRKAGSTLVAVAKGILSGIEAVRSAWEDLRESIAFTLRNFTGSQSTETITQFTKIATVIGIVTASVAPLLIALGGVGFFVSSVIVPAFGAIGTIASAAFTPLLVTLGVASIALAGLRDRGISFGDVMAMVMSNIKGAFDFVMENAIRPFMDGFSFFPNIIGFVWESVKTFASDMVLTFFHTIQAVSQAFQALAPLIQPVFIFIGNVVGFVATGIGLAFSGALNVVSFIVKSIAGLVIMLVEGTVNKLKTMARHAGDVAGFLGLDIAKDLKEFGAGEFRVRLENPQGFSVPERLDTPTDRAQQLAEAEAQRQAQGMIFTPGNIEDIASAVGDAVGAKMPSELNVNSKVCVDGKTIAKSTEKHRQEINERAGFKATPWQRRSALEHGAAPVGGR